MVKKAFGAGHSLTLCKAAEITRMRQTIVRRLSTVETSVDSSVPKSALRKFDDSKGKLQRRRLTIMRQREDAILQHRIKMLNARDPMIGEGPRYEGGSFHSPPPRAFEARRRADKYRTIARRRNIERLDKLNAKMANRLLQVQPTEISRRHGKNGWDQHYAKHAHWQTTSRKRKNIMNRLIHSRLIEPENSGDVSSGQMPLPKPPTKHHPKTFLLGEIHRHENLVQRTLHLAPVLSPVATSAAAAAEEKEEAGNGVSLDVDEVTTSVSASDGANPSSKRSDALTATAIGSDNPEQAVEQINPMSSRASAHNENIRQVDACKTMSFGVNSALRSTTAASGSNSFATTLVREWESAKTEWRKTPRGLRISAK